MTELCSNRSELKLNKFSKFWDKPVTKFHLNSFSNQKVKYSRGHSDPMSLLWVHVLHLIQSTHETNAEYSFAAVPFKLRNTQHNTTAPGSIKILHFGSHVFPQAALQQTLHCVHNTLVCLFITSEPLFVALIFSIPDKTSNSLFYSFRLV